MPTLAFILSKNPIVTSLVIPDTVPPRRVALGPVDGSRQKSRTSGVIRMRLVESDGRAAIEYERLVAVGRHWIELTLGLYAARIRQILGLDKRDVVRMRVSEAARS